MKIVPTLLRLTLLSALLAIVRTNAQTVGQVTVIKEVQYIQTSASSVAITPLAPGPFYGGPYSFSTEVSGSSISGITAPVISLAAGSTFPTDNPTEWNSGNLTYNSDSDSWKFGASGQDYNDPTQTALDTSFAVGTYGMTILGNSFSLNFGTNNNPANTPLLTLTGGSWVGGRYVIDPSHDLTITSNAFANFGANVDGVISLNVDSANINSLTFYSDNPSGPNYGSVTIPGGSLTAGQDYNGGVAFYALKDRPAVAGLPGALIAAGYGSSTRFMISAVTPPPVGAQATFYRMGQMTDLVGNNGGGGGGYSEVRDVTKTGGVIYAVGNSIAYGGSMFSDTCFLWTSTNGMTPLANFVDTTTVNPAFVTASAITPDAAYIAGRVRADSGGNDRHATRTTVSGMTNIDLGTLSGFPQHSAALAISNDGSVMYGFARYVTPGKTRAVRFTASGPTITAIPFLNVGDDNSTPAPRGASSDGSVMVGTSSNSSTSTGNPDHAGNQAFRYVYPAGTVTAIPFLSGGTWNGALALSADGNLALVSGNSTAHSGGEVYLYNNSGASTTSLGAPNGFTTPSNVGGMNSDGSLVVLSWGNSPNQCYLRNGSGWHSLSAIMTAAGVNLSSWSIDNVFGISADGTLVWGVGNHNGSPEGWVCEFNAGYLAGYGALHDFNADGKADIILQNMVTGNRGFWLMNGTAYASWVDLGVVATEWRIVATADFDGDGKPDFLWENTATGDRGFWLMNGTAYASWVSMGVVSTDWHIAGAADFNGDGKTDILWENTSTGDRGFWLMNGTAFVSWVDMGLVSTDWRFVATADFNADGKADILMENTVTGDRGFWLMNGTTFSAWVDMGYVSTDWHVAAAGDYDGDGKTDILWENTVDGTRGFWLMNGTNYSSWVPLASISTDWRLAP